MGRTYPARCSMTKHRNVLISSCELWNVLYGHEIHFPYIWIYGILFTLTSLSRYVKSACDVQVFIPSASPWSKQSRTFSAAIASSEIPNPGILITEEHLHHQRIAQRLAWATYRIVRECEAFFFRLNNNNIELAVKHERDPLRNVGFLSHYISASHNACPWNSN